MEENMEGVVFDDMDIDELQKTIVKYVKEVRRLNSEKKDFCDSIKDVVKELNMRIGSAISILDKKKASSG